MKNSREITVMVSNQAEPFVIYESNRKLLKGFDVEIMDNFAKKLRLTVKYIMVNESLNEIFSSADVNFFDGVDIFIGGLDGNAEISKHLVASRPYHHDSLTWCVQIRKPIPLRENMLYLFRDPSVWILFLMMAVVIVPLVYFLQQFDQHKKWDWNRITITGFAYYCGVTLNYKAKNDAHRILISMFLLGSSIYVISLSSMSTKFITTPILKAQVKSIQEIIDGGFSLAGSGFAMIKLHQQKEVNV